jgi:hypothetical protein
VLVQSVRQHPVLWGLIALVLVWTLAGGVEVLQGQYLLLSVPFHQQTNVELSANGVWFNQQ